MTRTHSPTESPGTADEAQGEGAEQNKDQAFPIVGVGASAGGLEAFTELLKHLPLDTGMAFVLVQHLDPQHESALTQILSRATRLPLHEVTDKLRVAANHIYVITPNTNIAIHNGVLQVKPRPQTRVPHRPIDGFFEALAQDQRERAIGVVLSGTATDGTAGLEAIKGEGGITFAQDDSAHYNSMPRSAVAAGCVDFILSPEQIAQELARIARHPYLAGQSREFPATDEDDAASATAHEDDDSPLPSGAGETARTSARQARAEAAHERAGQAKSKPTEEDYKKILGILRSHSGVDFALYKSSTIQRRITRRVVMSDQTTLEDYARFLRGNAKELDALYSDVLISVTGFFRNPGAFETLQSHVLPKLLQQRSEEPLRIWVLGCSTGQEAYSLAIAYTEVAEKAPRARRLQVFATDLNDALLDKARYGLYTKSLAEDVSPDRLRRFFVEEEGGYRINKALRERIVFARQNIISDPPFSRIDLISCRNLLIYLDSSVQKKAIPTLHYALKPGGYLFLGASESIGGFVDLFEPVDKKHKFYVKKPARTPALHLPLRKEQDERGLPRAPLLQGEATQALRGELDAQREADRIVTNRFAPPGVLIDDQLQVLQFRGPTAAYLTLPSGKASFDVLKMAPEGLMLPLRAAINHARKHNQSARKDNVRIKRNGETRAVNLEVIPLKNTPERCFLILFGDADTAPGGDSLPDRRPAPAAPLARDEATRRIGELETELAETRDYLQSMQEQHEAANEELQAANEETESANEELQSLNEELETSKEELESSNEELATVNEEMANRNAELNGLNNDLVNLQSSAQVPIVLLGRNLNIRRFTNQAEKELGLLGADLGRRIGQIRHSLVLEPIARQAAAPIDLERIAEEVITNVRETVCEVRDNSGRWYSLRVRPYISFDNKVDGAVLVLMDIDTLKRSEQGLAAARDYAESVIQTVREPLLVLDANLHVESANRSFYRSFRSTPAETIGKLIYELGNGQWDIPRLRERLEQIPLRDTSIEEFEVEHDFAHLGRRTMLLNARRIFNRQQMAQRVLLAIEDITERKRLEQEITAQASKLADVNRRKDEFLAMLSHELRNPLAPIFNALQLIGQDGGEAYGIIERQVRHLARLINDLLDISRISAGRIRLRIERVDINTVIERAVERVRHMLDQRAQPLSISASAQPLWLDADPDRLQQIVGNLLNNASKYSDAGGRIALTVERGDAQAIIRVRDEGGGMAADTLAHIFELFTQAEQSLARSQGGLGIGLALVKSLVELHGGTVAAHSEGLGQGSEFIVRLPLATSRANTKNFAAPVEPANGDSLLRILVVDDSDDAAKMASQLLRSWGHEVRVAQDGAGALRAAAEFRPQVILLDIGLPDMEGYEVARRIRQNTQSDGLRIIAITGYGQDADRQRSKEAGFDDHLVKPVEISDLKALLAGFRQNAADPEIEPGLGRGDE